MENNTAWNNTRYGIYILDSDYNNLTNNSAYDNTQFGLYLSLTDYGNLINNTAYINTQKGFYISNSQYNDFIDNNAYDNLQEGFYVTLSSNNTFTDNTAYGNEHGFYLSSSSNYNNVTHNTMHDNAKHGFYIDTSSYNMLSNNTAKANSNYGLYLLDSGGGLINSTTFYSNGYDFYVRSTGGAIAYNMTNSTFLNPTGTFENYTSLSIYDVCTANEQYSVNWTAVTRPLPEDRVSFREKWVNISNQSGTVSILSIKWHWLDSELTGYNESYFELWKWNASAGWTMLNDTPNTLANILALTAMNPASDYGILQNNFTGCPIITVSGEYNQTMNYFGAPNDAAPLTDYVCVKITVSDVLYDCNGYNITDNGTSTSWVSYGILLNGSLNNVTIRNCPSISNYTNGLYVYQSDTNYVYNSTSHNNTYAGFYLDGSEFNNLSMLTAYNNSQAGVYMDNSPNNTVNNVTSYNNTYGFYLNTAGSSNFTNVKAYNNSQDGLSGLYSPSVIIDPSEFHDNNANGVNLNNCHDVIVMDVKANGNNGNGMHVSQSDRVAITRLEVDDNQGHGLHIVNSDNLTMNDSEFCYNHQYGIRLQHTANITIRNSDICNNTDYGIQLDDANYTAIDVSRIYNNTDYGIYHLEAHNGNYTSNNVTENVAGGIYFGAVADTTYLDFNFVCFNDHMDINNNGIANNGAQDSCDWFYRWSESGHFGCTYSCSDFWHRFFGNGSGYLYLTDAAGGTIDYMYKWNGTPYNIYFTDYDSVIGWDALQAISRNTTGAISSNDFIELDNAFNGTVYPDNITETYSSDGTNPLQTKNYAVYLNPINNVPVANSTTNSSFQTGILWDTSDGGTEYTNAINQSTAWVVKVNSSIADVYGTYDYLGSIPYTLATYEGSNDLISVYVEIR